MAFFALTHVMFSISFLKHTKFNKTIGRITGFAPGTKENNALFSHANLFFVWALIKQGMPDLAYKVFSGINPLNHEHEIIRTGPWIPEYYISNDNPNIPILIDWLLSDEGQTLIEESGYVRMQ